MKCFQLKMTPNLRMHHASDGVGIPLDFVKFLGLCNLDGLMRNFERRIFILWF